MTQPGDIVAGRYRVERLLGQGGVGAVYEATQLKLGRVVALKMLLPARQDRRDARARFEREARVAAALKHPGVVEIYDFGDDSGTLFLAMERLYGLTLERRMAEGKLPTEEALGIASEMAATVLAAHEIGLVHRDLKPSNIFLEPRPAPIGHNVHRAVIVDFGLAFIRGSQGAGRITKEGLVAGTPEYISPEQALGQEVGPESDIYSFGCTLYEMLTGTAPFEDGSELGLLSQHLYRWPKPLRDAQPGPEVPQMLDDLVARMLSKRPKERPSALEVLEQLGMADSGSRERSRGDSALLSRQERMIADPSVACVPTLTERQPAAIDVDGPGAALGLVGEIDPEQACALRANGFDPCSIGAQVPAVIYAPESSLKELERLIRDHGAPLVTRSGASDMDRIAGALKIGVAEVVPEDAPDEQLARRLHRALKKHRRR